jgi:hypothetical protein
MSSQLSSANNQNIYKHPDCSSESEGCAMAYNRRDDDLAYGDYHGQQEGQEGDRGMIGDMGRRLFGGRKEVRLPSMKPSAIQPILSLYTLRTLHMLKLVRGKL